MNAKVVIWFILVSVMIGTSFSKPLVGFLENGFGNAFATGHGHGSVINGQVIGTGTGTANAEDGGFAIGLGIGIAVDTPLGKLVVSHGQSVSTGK